MATWAKAEIIFAILDPNTGSHDDSAHTIVVVPQGSSYPTNAVACSAKSAEGHMYGPDSDLDDDYNYHIYMDTAHKGMYPSKKATPMIGY